MSLSQTAYVELTNQLLNRQFTFEQWQAITPALSAVVDNELPIAPLGIALRVMLGVATAPEAEMKRGLRGLRAMWHVLKTATAAGDLEEGRRITFEGETREFLTSALKAILVETERRWDGTFERVVAKLGRPAVDSDRPMLADEIRRDFGEEDVRQIPELETAVQLGVEWLMLHGRRHKKGEGYKPKRNDAMDFEQLFALGLPAILCTSDGTFLERVRKLGTRGSNRVLRPNELLDNLRSATA